MRLEFDEGSLTLVRTQLKEECFPPFVRGIAPFVSGVRRNEKNNALLKWVSRRVKRNLQTKNQNRKLRSSQKVVSRK